MRKVKRGRISFLQHDKRSPQGHGVGVGEDQEHKRMLCLALRWGKKFSLLEVQYWVEAELITKAWEHQQTTVWAFHFSKLPGHPAVVGSFPKCLASALPCWSPISSFRFSSRATIAWEHLWTTKFKSCSLVVAWALLVNFSWRWPVFSLDFKSQSRDHDVYLSILSAHNMSDTVHRVRKYWLTDWMDRWMVCLHDISSDYRLASDWRR